MHLVEAGDDDVEFMMLSYAKGQAHGRRRRGEKREQTG